MKIHLWNLGGVSQTKPAERSNGLPLTTSLKMANQKTTSKKRTGNDLIFISKIVDHLVLCGGMYIPAYRETVGISSTKTFATYRCEAQR
jgi:hypothetical protein